MDEIIIDGNVISHSYKVASTGRSFDVIGYTIDGKTIAYRNLSRNSYRKCVSDLRENGCKRVDVIENTMYRKNDKFANDLPEPVFDKPSQPILDDPQNAILSDRPISKVADRKMMSDRENTILNIFHKYNTMRHEMRIKDENRFKYLVYLRTTHQFLYGSEYALNFLFWIKENANRYGGVEHFIMYVPKDVLDEIRKKESLDVLADPR